MFLAVTLYDAFIANLLEACWTVILTLALGGARITRIPTMSSVMDLVLINLILVDFILRWFSGGTVFPGFIHAVSEQLWCFGNVGCLDRSLLLF